VKFYVAHNFAARKTDELKKFVADMEALGHECTSRWLGFDGNGGSDEADMDLSDVARADMLILFAEQVGATPARGKYVELGYALAIKHIQGDYVVAVIRPKDAPFCIFYEASGVDCYESTEAFLDMMRRRNG
jgi:hypothetical protein